MKRKNKKKEKNNKEIQQNNQKQQQHIISPTFFCQNANKTGSNYAIIGCNLSKKHKSALYKTQSREPNYVDHKFFYKFFFLQKLGGKHPSTIELASWQGHLLCDIKAT